MANVAIDEIMTEKRSLSTKQKESLNKSANSLFISILTYEMKKKLFTNGSSGLVVIDFEELAALYPGVISKQSQSYKTADYLLLVREAFPNFNVRTFTDTLSNRNVLQYHFHYIDPEERNKD